MAQICVNSALSLLWGQFVYRGRHVVLQEQDSYERLYFDAVLHPCQSLRPRAFLIIMTCLGMFSLMAGVMFMLIGAWPVFIFFGLALLLFYTAIRTNLNDSLRYETVQVTDHDIVVRRINPKGKTTMWRFLTYWVRVELDDNARLTLHSHGHSVEFGKFLSVEEKESFRRALKDALARVRSDVAGPLPVQ